MQQADREENSHLFFQGLSELASSIASAGQKNDLPLVGNSPSNTNQEPGSSRGFNSLLGNAPSTPVSRVIYRGIPMSGSRELMRLTSSSIQIDEKNEDVPPPKEEVPSLAENREDLYKVQDENKPVQGKAKKFYKRMMILYCNYSQADIRKGLNVLILVLALVNLAIVIPFFISRNNHTDTKFRPVTSALSYIGSNLQSHPILDIKLQDDDEISCPEDYRKVLLGVWPGTVHGCDCSSGLKTGKCQKSEASPPDPSCDDYASRNPINMYDWGGSRWCVLRAKPGSQYVKKAGKCGAGFKKCSSGVCMKDTLDCPVTKVKLESGAIVMENVKGEAPVISLTITPNDIPCFSEAYFARGSVGPYPLIDENENGCGKYGLDEKYSFQMDSQKQSELFDENDFPEKVLRLPKYKSVYEKTDSILSYRKRLSIAETDFCLHLDTEILEKSSEAFDKFQNHMKGISLAALLVQSFLVGVVAITIGYSMCEGFSWRSAFTGKASGFWLCVYTFLVFIQEIVLIVMLAFIGNGRAKMRETEDYLNEIAAMGCFLDQQAQIALSDFHNLIGVETATPLKICLLMFFIAGFSLVCSIYLVWKRRNHALYGLGDGRPMGVYDFPNIS